ncbi:MAG: putative two-component response regulator [Gemmatimonadetes bacterium]|nr:putative two-component response regulator [Gemmatimonadota bacterium]
MDMSDPVVFVVDDDLSVREALRSLIRSVGLRCETFASAAEFVGYSRPDHPACLVLDVQLSDGSGLELSAELSQSGAELPIIFITGHGTIPMSVRAMKAGAVEFLTKPFSEQELLTAIEQALGRDRADRIARTDRQALRDRYAKLTARERDVFALVVAGRMNKEIAAELGTAEQTVKQHRGRVMHKLGARSVADLVHLAAGLEAHVVPR